MSARRREARDDLILRTFTGGDIEPWLGIIGICYCRVFVRPPWNEAEHAADRFLERLRLKSTDKGFRLVLAQDELGQVIGFAYGATTFGCDTPEPWYRRVADALCPGVTDAALVNAFELIELGVVPAKRDRGVGGQLHDKLLAGVEEPRAWLITCVDAREAVNFYSARGWLELGQLDVNGSSQRNLLMTRRLRD